MTVTAESFRTNHPEFTDPGKYSLNAINVYINLGVLFQNQNRWDPNIIDYGTELFIAHHLVLDARANATADAGGIPGTVQGVITSKGVDKVNVGYNTGSVVVEGASFWNMTTYGIRWIQLSKQYGSGGVQVGTPGCGPSGGWGWGQF